jgi:hypothetical protein
MMAMHGLVTGGGGFELGYEPEVDLRAGLRQTLEDHEERRRREVGRALHQPRA